MGLWSIFYNSSVNNYIQLICQWYMKLFILIKLKGNNIDNGYTFSLQGEVMSS